MYYFDREEQFLIDWDFSFVQCTRKARGIRTLSALSVFYHFTGTAEHL